MEIDSEGVPSGVEPRPGIELTGFESPVTSEESVGGDGVTPEHATGPAGNPYYTTPGPRELLTPPARDDRPLLRQRDGSAP